MDCMPRMLLLARPRARPVYIVNNIFCYAEMGDPRHDKTQQKILKNKNHEYFLTEDNP